MPSQLHSDIYKNDKIPVMNYKASVNKCSVQYQNVLEKQIAASLKNHNYKPWPSRKSTKVDEVVKYISNVPSHIDNRERVEDKALHRGRLEKWTYIQKQVANRKVGDSNDKVPIRHTNEQEKINNSDIRDQCVGSLSSTLIDKDTPTSKAMEKSQCNVQQSVLSNSRSIEVNCKSFSEIISPSDIIITHSPQMEISQSNELHKQLRPLTLQNTSNVKNEVRTDNAKGKQAESKIRSSSPLRRDLSPHRLLRAGFNRIRNSSSREGSSISSDNTKMPTTPCSDKSRDDSVSTTRKGRRSSSPQRILNAGLNLLRNSSTKEVFSEQTTKESVCSDHSIEDDATSNIKSRRSPLRRLFDPLIPKNQVHVSGPVTSLPSHRATEVSNRDKLPIRDELNLVHKPTNNSSRQALLKLARKNGLPFFVFSSCHSNILATTVGKSENNNDCECTYTIFTAQELKKKGGVWTNHVNKNRKHDLVHNVVAHMRVTSSISTEEFVLYDAEQISTTKHELVAVVLDEQNGKIVIVPEGVHGIASTGEPSPLIERWKSGGICDCGGWDEGCPLTFLTDQCHEKRGCTSSDRIEFFTQGEKKNNKYAFSMITFKEGVYTVDFGVNISSVQAFAMCIASLHSKFNNPVETQNLDEQTIIDNASVNSTRIVPEHHHHPPIRKA